MILQNIPFLCLACHHRWMHDLVMDAPAKVVIASMCAIHCPQCEAGWKRIAIANEPSRDDTAG
jgi:hypothetical protein